MSALSRRRWDYDLLRVASMVGVVYLHTAAGALRQLGTPLWHFSNLLSSLATAAVPLFFMLSGALLLSHPRTAELGTLFRRRLPKVLIPLLAWSGVVIALAGVLSGPQAALDKLIPLLNTPVMVPYWFLYALVPIYLLEERHRIPQLCDTKSVFTIHNIEYQGRYGSQTLKDVFGLNDGYFNEHMLAYHGDVNLMKGAIYAADYVTTVSPTYADELQYSFYAHGLEGVIADNRHKLRGILNGIDTEVYDPWRDKGLTKFFSARQMAGKKNCKAALQQMSGLRENPDAPIIACVSRLVRHKGFDLVTAAIHEIMGMDVQMIVLGTGDWNYEEAFRQAQNQYPGRFAAHMMYSPNLSTAIYGGADIFLMPSIAEPCGLSQMIAMRYGTIPVVRETGGLRDSVVPYNKFTGEGTGFSFANINVQEMTGVLSEAVNLYHSEPKAWKALQKNAMTADFSWEKSAKAYEEIYGWVTGK